LCADGCCKNRNERCCTEDRAHAATVFAWMGL
jgi:hypothetical protein